MSLSTAEDVTLPPSSLLDDEQLPYGGQKKAPSALAAFGYRETTATSPAAHDFQRQPNARRPQVVSGVGLSLRNGT